MNATDTPLLDTTVTAQHAPLDVLLWPVRDGRHAPNFTLADVNVKGDTVIWTYRNGKSRHFPVDTVVMVRVARDDFPAVAASQARGLLDAPVRPAQVTSTHYADRTATRPTRTVRALPAHIVGTTS